MKKIITERVGSIVKEKKRLEEALNLKISNRGKEFYLEGEPLDEYEAEQVLNAVNFGFKIEIALMIKEKELSLNILSIKDYTKRKDMSIIKSRIIGTKGKTMKTLSELTDCFFEVHNNEVGIIGHPEKMKIAQEAVINLIRGAKQANVYKYLEKHQVRPVIDLGLK
jgi:ribosomal RNA assembly protein